MTTDFHRVADIEAEQNRQRALRKGALRRQLIDFALVLALTLVGGASIAILAAAF